MKSLLRWLSLACLALTVALPAAAQGDRVDLTARFVPSEARPGETVRLVLTATVEFGYHAYGKLETVNVPVSLPLDTLDLGGLQAVGEARIPDGTAEEHFGLVQYPLPDRFEVSLDVKVPADREPGTVEVEGQFGYQVCNQSGCDLPTTASFTAKLHVVAGEVRPEYAGAEAIVAAPEPPLPGLPGMGGFEGDKLTLAAHFHPGVARAGETVQLVLEAEVIEGWHAYGKLETTNLPVSLPLDELDLGGLQAVGEPDIPDGDAKEVMGLLQYPLPEQFEVLLDVFVPPGTAPGEFTAKGTLHYQLCDQNSCEQPAAAAFAAKLVVESGAPREKFVAAKPHGEAMTAAPEEKKVPFGGLWGLILACIGGGLFALAMPCTYPMIPITFSFFTKQAEKRGGNVMALALVYGLGIITIFVFVGVALSRVIIPFVNHWATNAVIGAVFLMFAFVLFGWINLQPPRFVQNLSTKASGTGGLLGVFFMGATLVISSFTCTAPIVGSLIAKVSEYGTLTVGLGMAVFGLTMAIPFVFLALMPTKVKAMPRSGEWMDTLKISLGFVELAAVLKFLSMVDIALGWQFLNRELFLLLTGTILLFWAMFLFGFLRKAGEPYVGVGAGRQATGMFVVLLAVYLFSGAMGHRIDKYMTSFAPSYSAEFVVAHAGGGGNDHAADSRFHAVVYDDPVRAAALAVEADKLLLYNFTGFN